MLTAPRKIYSIIDAKCYVPALSGPRVVGLPRTERTNKH